MKRVILLLLALLLTYGAGFADADCESYNHDDISVDSVWGGEKIITKPVIVRKGSQLKILPGARITFDVPPTDSHEPPPFLYVEGKLSIEGTENEPVSLIVRGEVNNPPVQDMINVMEGEGVSIDNAIFETPGWALHIHGTPSKVKNSTFRNSYGGMRFNNDSQVITGCAFEGNRIGIRALNSAGIEVTNNDFTANLTGIFFRTGIVGAAVTGNNFDNSEYDIKLGEGQEGAVEAANNWWASHPVGVEEKIYDGNDSEGVGIVTYLPVEENRIARRKQ